MRYNRHVELSDFFFLKKKKLSSIFAKSYICELTLNSHDSVKFIFKGNTKNGQRQLFI